MSREIELKYRFPEDRIPQLLSDPWLSAEFCGIAMESTYFDNAEHTLQEKRITFPIDKFVAVARDFPCAVQN